MSSFFNHVRNIPTDAYEVLISIGKKVINPDSRTLTKMAIDVVGYFDSIITEAGSDFPVHVAKSLLQMLTGPISSLEMSSLMLFSHASAIVDTEFLLSFVPLLPLAIVSEIESLPPITPHESGNSPYLVLPESTHFSVVLEPLTHKTFDGEIDLTCDVQFPERISLEELVRSDIIVKLQLILKVIDGNATLLENMICIFSKFLESEDHQTHIYDLFAAFFFIFDQLMQQLSDITPPLEVLCNKTLFNPSVTVFHFNVDNWRQINSLRAMAIDFLLCEGIRGFQYACQQTARTPLIFAEIIHRFLLVQPCLSIDKLEIPILSQTILVPMIIYQQMRDISDEERCVVNVARKSLFMFLVNMFSDGSFLRLLFCDPFFIESFLAIAFETPVRAVVLSPLMNYLAMPESSGNKPLIQKVLQIFDVAMDNLTNVDVIKAACDILAGLNNVVVSNEGLRSAVIPIIPKVVKGIVCLPKCEESKILVTQFLTFLANMSNVHSIDSLEITALDNAIKNVFEKEPGQTLFVKTVELMAGQHLSSLYPSFLVREAKAMKLLVSLFRESSMIKDVFGFVASLCQYDRQNCLKAHEGELDLFLIQMLERWRDDGNMQIVTVASAFSLLMVIMNVVCSVSVVQSFVSLLCQVDGKYLPVFHQVTIKSLSKLLLAAKARERVSLPLICEAVFDVDGLSSEMLGNAFTFTFWICVNHNHPQYRPRIFSVMDTKNQMISVYMQGRDLFVRVGTLSSHHTLNPGIVFPNETWSFVSCTFHADEKSQRLLLSISVNGSKSNDLLCPFVKFAAGPMVMRIGGAGKDSVVPGNPAQLGSIGLFNNFSEKSISCLMEQGRFSTNVKQFNPLFYFIEKQRNGRLHLKNIVTGVVRTKRDSLLSHQSSFTDVLIDHCGIDFFIPLFAQWDLTFRNGEKLQFMPETTIELWESALQLSTDLQDQLAATGGMKAISHLMMATSPKNLTYQVYLRWFSLHGILTSKTLQKQTVELIVMNPAIWIRCDAETHEKIVHHWADTIAPSYGKSLGEIRSFSWILSVMRLYYWYTPCEETCLARNRVQGQKLNVSRCRQDLLEIAHVVASAGLCENDFRCLMSHIFTCIDHSQSVDLMVFLKKLLIFEKELLIDAKESMGLVSMLQYLFNIRSTAVTCTTFETIIAAHRAKLMDTLSLDAHIDIILHQLTSDFVSKDLLKKLIGITETGVPELFPICSWMAMNLGKKSLMTLLTKITPGSHLGTCEFWAMWLVVALFKSKENVQKQIFRFLIKSTTETFKGLLANIEVIGRALGENPELVKAKLANELGEMMLEADCDQCLSWIMMYFELVRHVLFFRSKYQISDALSRAISESPFGRSDSLRQKKPLRSRKSESRRRARHSLHPNSLMVTPNPEKRYSPAIAEQAISFFNQENASRGFEHRNSFRSKRSSLFVLGRMSFDYEPRPSTDPKLISMMPSELDEMINEVSHEEFPFVFGLRLSENGDWLDQKLAEQSLKIFKQIPDTRCAETVLAISSFLLHYNQDIVKSVLPSVNTHCTGLMKVLSLFRYHAEKTRFKTDIPMNQSCAFQCLQTFETPSDKIIAAGPLRFLKHLLLFQSQNSTTAFNIFGMIDNDIISLASNFMAECTDKSGEMMRSSSKRWSRYWNHFTIAHGPWHKSLPASSIRESHYKRDSTRCLLCPVKVRRNFHFDDHMKASLVRDTGSRVSAEKQMEKLKAELAAQYKEDLPSTLFEVVQDKERTERNMSYSFAQCIAELPCEIVSITGVKLGSFSLLEDSIILSNEDRKTIVIKLCDVTEVFLRTRFHHPTAIEIFLENGKNYFINFPNIKAIPILKSLRSLKTPRLRSLQCEDFKSYFASTKYTKDWMNRRISNFEYLMRLNMCSGRTFNDPSQYPILPWVLSDYSSSNLNISDPSIYRDLSVPIGAYNQERLNGLKDRVQQFQNMGTDMYLYSSGYVCPLSVYLWLIRQEPFTSLHIDIQSGRFDHAARQFSSIANSFNLSTTHQNDFRELIPEFFTTPEFLTNKDNFDLGSVNGKSISNVELPPWAETPFDFIYMNRKALESDYVSNRLQNWIDLVWGEKQRGEKAAKADNVFMPQMYDDIWTLKNLKDPTLRAEIEAILCHVGQIPPQLFDKPHPTRMPRPPSICGIFKPLFVNLQTKKNVIASSIRIEEEKKIYITGIDATGYCFVTSFTLSQINQLSKDRKTCSQKSAPNSSGAGNLGLNGGDIHIPVPPESVISAKLVKDFPGTLSDKHVACPMNDGSFLFTVRAGNELCRIMPQTGATLATMKQKSDILTIVSEGDWVAIANDDAGLAVYRQNQMKKPVFTVPAFTNQIQCCGIDSDYHMIVCGMRNGSLLLCSLSDGSIVKIIDLEGCRPRAILITKAWGFIMVYMTRITDGQLTHHISLYSVNGDFIRTVELQFPMAAWSTYKSSDGFDYIVMVDSESNVYHFEAYYLNLGHPFHKLGDPIIGTSFIKDASIAILLTANGRAIFLPCRVTV